MNNELYVNIRNLPDLLSDSSLTIPSYQRPYTWQEDQVLPLVKDLFNANKESPLIMGSIILWRNGEKTEIVDGQQRLTTLSIFVKLTESDCPNHFLSQRYTHTVSINNIKSNARHISDFIEKRGRERFEFPLENIYFIVLYVPTLSEAFTFFDGQNTRGKKLNDSDILKAHHLRFILGNDLAKDCSVLWERIQKDKDVGVDLLLENLIGQGRKFSRKEVSEVDIKKEFKSQRVGKSSSKFHAVNKYQQPPVFDKWLFDPLDGEGLKLFFADSKPVILPDSIGINKDFYRYFPFQVTQSIEGGEIFFWFTHKYHRLYKELFIYANPLISDFLNDLIIILLEFSYSTGANYVHELFTAALLFYFDKFGYEDLDTIAAHLFFSVYWLRFRQSSVQYASVFKFIREADGFNPFELISRAGFSGYLINYMNDFLEGKYRELWESQGLRRQMFNRLISYVTKGYFSHHEYMLPKSISHTLKRPNR
jgi:hypothetical protein